MIISRARLSGAVVALAAAGTLAACSSGSGSSSSSAPEKGVGSSVPVSAAPGASGAPSSGAPSSGAPSSGAPSSGPPGPSAASSSGSGPGRPASTALSDFTQATFTTPSGFERSSSYSPAVPLESSYTSSFVVPTDAPTGRTVIGVYVYALPASGTVTKSTDIPARIRAYNAKLKATATYPISTFTAGNLDGNLNYKEGVTQPPNFTYLAYFSFGTHHVMELTCQYADPAALSSLATPCGVVLGSMQLR